MLRKHGTGSWPLIDTLKRLVSLSAFYFVEIKIGFTRLGYSIRLEVVWSFPYTDVKCFIHSYVGWNLGHLKDSLCYKKIKRFMRATILVYVLVSPESKRILLNIFNFCLIYFKTFLTKYSPYYTTHYIIHCIILFIIIRTFIALLWIYL